jgi:hypothetical protein
MFEEIFIQEDFEDVLFGNLEWNFAISVAQGNEFIYQTIEENQINRTNISNELIPDN